MTSSEDHDPTQSIDELGPEDIDLLVAALRHTPDLLECIPLLKSLHANGLNYPVNSREMLAAAAREVELSGTPLTQEAVLKYGSPVYPIRGAQELLLELWLITRRAKTALAAEAASGSIVQTESEGRRSAAPAAVIVPGNPVWCPAGQFTTVFSGTSPLAVTQVQAPLAQVPIHVDWRRWIDGLPWITQGSANLTSTAESWWTPPPAAVVVLQFNPAVSIAIWGFCF
jgi:hypothetical protein